MNVRDGDRVEVRRRDGVVGFDVDDVVVVEEQIDHIVRCSVPTVATFTNAHILWG